MFQSKQSKTDFNSDVNICAGLCLDPNISKLVSTLMPKSVFGLFLNPGKPQRYFDTDVEICFELELGPNSPKQSVLGNVQAQAGLPLGPRSPKQTRKRVR